MKDIRKCKGIFEEFSQQRGFWSFFKRKKENLRKGAMSGEKVKNVIQNLDRDKVLEITRIGYDGEIDDIPLSLKILSVDENGFSAIVLNPERSVIENSTSSVIYAKRGGGNIEFNYSDGDIYSIEISKDEDILNDAKNIDQLKELVKAIDLNDPVLICYWEKVNKGTINVQGFLVKKSEDCQQFSVKIDSINNIELEEKKVLDFDLNTDLVIDLQYAG